VAAPKYGTANLTYLRVAGIEFFPPVESGYNNWNGIGRFPTAQEEMDAPFHLPGGAIIDYLEIDFCDYLDPQDIQLYLIDCAQPGGTCSQVANVNSYGAPGCSQISTSGINYQVDNVAHGLYLQALFGAVNNSNLLLMGALVGYRLQVSPPPATADFTDVPTSSSQFQFIEALYHSGITAGCGGGNFCPNSPVTRGQMAVFLAKALGLNWP